jgi:hypothetical protein
MSLSPETKRGDLSIQERPEEFSSEVPVEVENKSVPLMSAVPTKAKPLYDDNGQPLVGTPETEEITITIPKPKEQLINSAKGAIDDSRTWDAKYWLRQIAKAIVWGWNWVVGGNRATA